MRTSTAMRRHDFDPIAFVFGLAFTGLGGLFMVGRFGVFNHARWLWPGLLVLLGIAVLAGARGRGDPRRRERAPGAGAGAGAAPSDLDSIEPPVGPDAFRLPGWPAPGATAPPEGEAKVTPPAPAETEAIHGPESPGPESPEPPRGA